eukprot:TRINITY_DN970_c0_g7_i1.p1 TRINITY_DN970_c0_g7~~TRINITY_DN970_c0_g7_i1.p1  ORF type:complete len:230 (+),score=67.91 TRINITY_DN970_c0_g7_i1:189-878(+)
MNFSSEILDDTHSLQSSDEPELQIDAPPFIPKAKSFTCRSEEEKREESVLKADARPFYPKHRAFPLMPLPTHYSSVPTPLQTLPMSPYYWPSAASVAHIQPHANLPDDHLEEPLQPAATHYDFASEVLESDEEIIDAFNEPMEELLLLELEEESKMMLEDLAKEVIKIIPAHPFEKQNDMNEECPICLEIYKLKDSVKTIECGHTFHEQCIDQWLVNVLKCPLCRHSLV